MLKRTWILSIVSLALTACTTMQQSTNEPSSLLAGNWDNSAQMVAAPQELKRPPVAGGAYEWIDAQYAAFFAVDVPALTGDGSKAIYLIWRSASPTGPISRQRLWVFRKGANGATGMDFYAFKNPEIFAGANTDAGQFKSVTLADLTAYGPACTLPVIVSATGWHAAIPSTCAITARSGRQMTLSAQIIVDDKKLSYSERGTLESGALAFKVPGGSPYQFLRQNRVRP